MKYVTPSSKDVEAAEAQIRQDYAQYGQATAHPAKITKEQAEQLAATLPDCEFREEGHGLFTFQRIGLGSMYPGANKPPAVDQRSE